MEVPPNLKDVPDAFEIRSKTYLDKLRQHHFMLCFENCIAYRAYRDWLMTLLT